MGAGVTSAGEVRGAQAAQIPVYSGSAYVGSDLKRRFSKGSHCEIRVSCRLCAAPFDLNFCTFLLSSMGVWNRFIQVNDSLLCN